ncbi:lamin tail domain-containing protein [Candidatus Roizmanbacteria bacterium]|nr:lamin tail domain-containing protein [Candidatus Roizmanbacteria bacterium]
MEYLIRLIVLVIFVVAVSQVKAFEQVFINEFQVNDSPQTIEILNTSSNSADISHWHLDDSGGTTYYTFPANSILQPNSCLVIQADINLNATSADTIRLFDATAPPTTSSAHLIDLYAYSTGPGKGYSYGRASPTSGTWTKFTNSFGFFNDTLLSCLPSPTVTPSLIDTSTPSVTPTPLLASPTVTPPIPTNIYLSEVMTYPITADKYEWVELYNNNDQDVALEKWYIDDRGDSGSTPKQFSLTIKSKSFATYILTTSMFNNDGDQVRLLNPNKAVVDGFEYGDSEQGKTWGRVSIESDTFCLQDPTPLSANKACIVDTATQPPIAISTNTPAATTPAKITPGPSISRKIASSSALLEVHSATESSEVLGATHVATGSPRRQQNTIFLIPAGAAIGALGYIIFRIKRKQNSI